MNAQEQKCISKFLSLVLRHQPDVAGLSLDKSGWVAVNDLLIGLAANERRISFAELQTVVRENDKGRFEFDEGGHRIRARQGHSVGVDLGYTPKTRPEILYHGTPEKFVDAIRRKGLLRQQRHHVHLHADRAVASSVGQRRGKPIVLVIRSLAMHKGGQQFFVTSNNVWLTDHVPPDFIGFP
ncbi:MAG: RNA 2'-phosphotransferase [Fuerstiella sp.]|nr:RNA 2'-phosphotransferase [Fuerstiella sp.]